jgi:uncharacterized protein (TIGR00369 family)
MQKPQNLDPAVEARARAGFALQGLMKTIGAEITHVAAGECRIEMPFDAAFTQQDGFVHAGIITSIVDTACGFAAYTLMGESSGVLSVEYKVNFLRPAAGEKFIATGRVLKPGRTLTVCSGEVTAISKDGENLIAAMQATMMAIPRN